MNRNRDEEREERRKYDGDVYYEVWRSGGNPDRVDPDRLDDRYWNGESAEEAARGELRRQENARQQRAYEEGHYAEQEYQRYEAQQWPEPPSEESFIGPAPQPEVGQRATDGPKPQHTCQCDLRTKLVGDGCAICNPEYAAQHTDQENAP